MFDEYINLFAEADIIRPQTRQTIQTFWAIDNRPLQSFKTYPPLIKAISKCALSKGEIPTVANGYSKNAKPVSVQKLDML